MNRATIWLVAAVSIAAVTAIGRMFSTHPNTVGFVYLIAVLLLSVTGGLLIGTLASVIAALCYNFFFFPPLYTLNVETPANWFSLAAFFIAAVIGSRLVAAAHLQAVRESEALKTSLLRAISHDLASPITAVSIRTESIRRRAGKDRDLMEDVTAIAEETSRLRRRIENLLSMARLEAGKTKPHREPTPPADLFRNARENLPMVPMIVHVADDCPDANVDPSLALEILVNLIENAHRVSPSGAPIELAAAKHPGDASMLRIEVLDRGPGLPRAIEGDVAQRGLGLEIARSFAAANGGSIGHVPREGGGTVALIDLPAAKSELDLRA